MSSRGNSITEEDISGIAEYHQEVQDYNELMAKQMGRPLQC